MDQMAFYVNIQRCIGCRTCEIACKDKNDLRAGPRLRRVIDREGGNYPYLYAYHVSIACNHCEEPACIVACPVQALLKRQSDGIVTQDYDKCIGCRRCEQACPYGAPQYVAEDRKVKKCHFCNDLIDQGLAPACVSACIMRALGYGKLKDMELKLGVTKRIKDFVDPSLTKPAIVFNPTPESQHSYKPILKMSEP